MINYIAAYDIQKHDALVSCPACGREIAIDRESIDKNDWVATCGCGGVFGVVSPERFAKYVTLEWRRGGNGDGTIAYCDFIIREVNTKAGILIVRRWHGWVDANTREIVQIG